MQRKTPLSTEPAEIREEESFQRAFHSHWDGFKDPVIDPVKSETKQIERLMRAHLAKVFGGDESLYDFGFFTAMDLGQLEQIGYRALSIGMFPDDVHGKPTMTPGVASALGCKIHADGTLRWGKLEKFVCVIRHDIRARVLRRQAEAEQALLDRHIPEGKKTEVVENPGRSDTTELTTEVEIFNETHQIPKDLAKISDSV